MVSKTKIEKSESKIRMFSTSKRKIEKRARKKKNPNLVDAIIKIKKKNPHIAKLLALPVKKHARVNLKKIEAMVKEGDKILIPGKILSSGNLSKKIKIVAWSASEKAKEKIAKAKAEFVHIKDELKKNPELKDFTMIK